VKLQEQEEALKTDLYQEINQIKAELAKQKKINTPLIVLSWVSTGILFPLIVWAIQTFLINQKWPLVIQTTTSLTPSLVTYILLTTICTELFVWWLLYRITHPFKCTCGYTTWFPYRLRQHLNGHPLQIKKAK
jgi:hypothetical protein